MLEGSERAPVVALPRESDPLKSPKLCVVRRLPQCRSSQLNDLLKVSIAEGRSNGRGRALGLYLSKCAPNKREEDRDECKSTHKPELESILHWGRGLQLVPQHF